MNELCEVSMWELSPMSEFVEESRLFSSYNGIASC